MNIVNDEQREKLIIRMNQILHENKIVKRRLELKQENVYKIVGTDSNGGERLIYMELLEKCGKIIGDYGGDIIYPPTSSGVFIMHMWGTVHYSYFEVIDETEKTFDLQIFEYVANDLCFALHDIISVKKIPKRIPIKMLSYEETNIKEIWEKFRNKYKVSIFSEKEEYLLNDTLKKLTGNEKEKGFIIYYNTFRNFMSLNFLKTLYSEKKLQNKFEHVIGTDTCYEKNNFYEISFKNGLSKNEKELLKKIDNSHHFIINKGDIHKIIGLLLSEKK